MFGVLRAIGGDSQSTIVQMKGLEILRMSARNSFPSHFPCVENIFRYRPFSIVILFFCLNFLFLASNWMRTESARTTLLPWYSSIDWLVSEVAALFSDGREPIFFSFCSLTRAIPFYALPSTELHPNHHVQLLL